MDIDEIMEEYDLKKTTLFKNYLDMSLSEILQCMSADVLLLPAGEEYIPGDSACAMILKGSLNAKTADGNILTLTYDANIGKGFYLKDGAPYFISFSAADDSALLTYDYECAMHPCWFSCFYHSALINNMVKIVKTQNEAIGIPTEYSLEAQQYINLELYI